MREILVFLSVLLWLLALIVGVVVAYKLRGKEFQLAGWAYLAMLAVLLAIWCVQASRHIPGILRAADEAEKTYNAQVQRERLEFKERERRLREGLRESPPVLDDD